MGLSGPVRLLWLNQFIMFKLYAYIDYLLLGDDAVWLL
jgi:hypothetical protein